MMILKNYLKANLCERQGGAIRHTKFGCHIAIRHTIFGCHMICHEKGENVPRSHSEDLNSKLTQRSLFYPFIHQHLGEGYPSLTAKATSTHQTHLDLRTEVLTE